MKFKLFFLPVVTFLCSIPASPVFAQEETPQGQLMTIHEDVVIPSKVDKYEKAAKNLASVLAKNNIASLSYTAANSEDFVYIYITPVENLAGVENIGAGFGELQKKMGKEAFQSTMSQFDDCYDSHRNYMVRMRPDLSYNPEYGSQISDGMNFRHWDFYYIHPGMEEKATEIAKEWKALYEKNMITEGYRLYFGALGTEMPLLIVAQSANNAVEFYTRSEAEMKTFGEAGQALLKKTWSVVRKFDHKDGSMRPDLSYLPTQVTKSK
jgi:hypothetical protein